jgi:hypothetical protein
MSRRLSLLFWGRSEISVQLQRSPKILVVDIYIDREDGSVVKTTCLSEAVIRECVPPRGFEIPNMSLGGCVRVTTRENAASCFLVSGAGAIQPEEYI